MQTILELQQIVIKDCNAIYQHYINEEKMDWECWWKKTIPYMTNKYINEDKSIFDFMQYRLQITFRDLQVVKGYILWPIVR